MKLTRRRSLSVLPALAAMTGRAAAQAPPTITRRRLPPMMTMIRP